MINCIKNQKYIINLLNIPIIVLFLSSALINFSCGGGAQERIRQEQLKEVKESVTNDLNKIAAEINQRIEYLEVYIENAEDNLKKKLEDSYAELKKHKQVIEKELEIVEDATLKNWDDVIDNTSEKVRQVRSKTSEVSKKVQELIEK